jgi:glycosyltransferase involved in cell wall biosynthesis
LPDLDLDLPAPFNFLVVAQFTGQNPKVDRKRLKDTVRWLCEAFDGDPDTGIIIKANMGRNTKIDRNVCLKAIREIIPRRKDDMPRVHFLHGAMTEEEIAGLYRHPRVGALVTATRGEGFGLPILEAAASGLPVVATDWSGHLDFMNRGRFIKLDYTLKPIPEERRDNEIFMPQSRWAEVDEFDFKKKVRKLRESHQVPRGWASDLKEVIQAEYSQAAIERHYDELLGDIL